jgi:hypothetical protein
MSIISSLFILIIITFTSCASGQPAASVKNIQVVEYITQHYEPAANDLSNPFWSFKDKIWFKDSVAIEEVRQLNIHENAKGIKSQEYAIRHYRFSDLRKGVVYEYKSFSDTATLIWKYAYRDSVQVIGGWGFNYVRHGDGTYEILSDTVIDDISYKRAKVSRGTKELPYIIICYFRCDKKGTIFNLDPFLSDIIGCPLVKIYNFSPVKKGLHITSEVKFLPDTLTSEELKVFAAWEKYANENPVNK